MNQTHSVTKSPAELVVEGYASQKPSDQTRSLPRYANELVVLGRMPADRLPLELVHRILEYDGRIKYRHGKYMNQICKDDYRYHLLRKIPVFRRDKWYSSNFFVYQMNYNNYDNENKHMMLVYIFEDSITYLYINKECEKYNVLR